MEWRLLNFGMKDGYFIQSVYEAVAQAVTEKKVPNTIILVSPASPYVCIGIHQELEKEVDGDYCAEHEIPIIRRQTGGGAVYLDSSQQFYQIIVHKNDPSVPLGIEAFYEHFLIPTVNVYRKYGLPAQYRPINDVMINGKKASGNGAVTLGQAMVLIGNVICDMDTKTMVDVLKVPSEKFRDKMFKSLEKYMTSLQNELEDPPHRDEISEHLIAEYESLLSCSLKRGTLTPLEEEYLTPVLSTLRSKEWLHRPSRRRERLLSQVEAKCTKVAGGIMVCEASHKAQKLIRITLESVHGRISDILISGDFFYEPAEYLSELEEELKGMKIRKKLLTEKIETFFDTHNIQLAGVTAKDFVEAIIQAHSKVKR
ncbi:MAG: lipoate--protein ligase family protein [Theionarchaea archaeon]|nr:lipoate--protein ligase family protein [Theionarchaea archaeon]